MAARALRATPARRPASIRRSTFLENTLPSMRAAFEAGADIVEFDIHPTTDGHFAVFHDWTVDCRTEGRGVTREHTLAAVEGARRRLRLHRRRRQDLSVPRPRRRHDAVARRGARGVSGAALPDQHQEQRSRRRRRLLAARLRQLPAERQRTADGLWRRRADRGDAPRTARRSRRCRARRSSNACCAISPSAGPATCRPPAATVSSWCR